MPQRIPHGISLIDDEKLGPIVPPGWRDVTFGPANGHGAGMDLIDLGGGIPVVMPGHGTSSKPPRVSHWAEGNLLHRVQPVYPDIARVARIQGTVRLRAIVGKTGRIENLNLLNGHPMLVKAALDAVKQWRYRPYLLNGEPIEVETEITVNFILGN
jgi:protein TonB